MGGGGELGRTRQGNEFKNIKCNAAADILLNKIDITERVMKRINDIQNTQHTANYKPFKRVSLTMVVIALLLLTSLTVYAANEYIQIRNHEGDIKVESTILKPISNEAMGIEELEESYRRQVLTELRPGQVLAYYVRDERISPAIKFLYQTDVSSSYSELAELMLRTHAPFIKEPPDRLWGLEFSHGNVRPILPNEYNDETAAEYNRLQDMFQTKLDTVDDQSLFIEPVMWTRAENSQLVYENYGMTLSIEAAKNVIQMEMAFSTKYEQKKIVINGVEIISGSYTEEDLFDYQATWYDEIENVFYTLKASGTGELTDNQFLKIVKDMVKG